jgi:hypothetical protein
MAKSGPRRPGSPRQPLADGHRFFDPVDRFDQPRTAVLLTFGWSDFLQAMSNLLYA